MKMRDEIMAVQKELNELKEQSIAWEMLQDNKKEKKRLFIMWIITFIALIGVSCYTVYLLNDIGTVTETSTQEIDDVDTIENSNITNGDMYGENKANNN